MINFYILFTVAPPPPERISTQISRPQEILFIWDKALEYICPTLEYNFTSQNCGTCTVVAPQVVNCTRFQTSTAGINCTFTVWSVVCGNVTGPGSMQSVTVSLKGATVNSASAHIHLDYRLKN